MNYSDAINSQQHNATGVTLYLLDILMTYIGRKYGANLRTGKKNVDRATCITVENLNLDC